MKALIFLAILLMCELSCAAEVDDLLLGLLARDQAWTSGRVKWTYTTSSMRKSGVGISRPPQLRFLSFQGKDWAIGLPNHAAGGGIADWGHPVHVSCNDRSTVWPKTFSHPTSIYSLHFMTPIWAGGIYKRDAALWVRNNQHRFTMVGEETVNGLPTKILEASIKGEDEVVLFLDYAHPSMFAAIGKVRLYVVPSLGYVLTRTDVRGSGPVIQRIDQTDFVEAAQGIHVSTRIDIARVGMLGLTDPNDDVTGSTATHVWLELLDVELVNQPIPKSDFEIP